MTQTAVQSVITLLAIAVVTFVLRALPFMLFRGSKPVPPFISYLGKVLPFAVIGMLVVYCLKDVSFISETYGLPELIAIVVIVILHKWKHNLLLSVGGGTVLYMLLVQFVFI